MIIINSNSFGYEKTLTVLFNYCTICTLQTQRVNRRCLLTVIKKNSDSEIKCRFYISKRVIIIIRKIVYPIYANCFYFSKQ